MTQCARPHRLRFASNLPFQSEAVSVARLRATCPHEGLHGQENEVCDCRGVATAILCLAPLPQAAAATAAEINRDSGGAFPSLILGGPLYQLWRRTRLVGDALQSVRRRVMPLLLLLVAEGHAWGDSVKLPSRLCSEERFST